MIFSLPPPWRPPCAGAPGGDRLVARLLLGLLEGLKLTLQVVLRDRGEDLVEVCGCSGSTALTWSAFGLLAPWIGARPLALTRLHHGLATGGERRAQARGKCWSRGAQLITICEPGTGRP
jgi:hypothetical protein